MGLRVRNSSPITQEVLRRAAQALAGNPMAQMAQRHPLSTVPSPNGPPSSLADLELRGFNQKPQGDNSLEGFSYNAGRGLTNLAEGLSTLVTDPYAGTQMLEGLYQYAANPRQTISELGDYLTRNTRDLAGLGTLLGDNPDVFLPGLAAIAYAPRGTADFLGNASAKEAKRARAGLKPGTVQPTDVPTGAIPPLEVPKEVTRKTKRGELSGAPAHITSPGAEVAAIESYLTRVEHGAPAANWYRDESQRIFAMSGGRPGIADRAAGSLGPSSANSTLPANTIAGVRGYNQGVVGAPIKTATGLVDSRIAELYNGFVDHFGPKISAYVHHLRSAWDKPPAGTKARAVHDIWDARAWGYPDEVGIGDAQHRWMDRVTDAAVKEANRRRIGGRDDWTVEELQASAWTSMKAEELKIDPAELAHGYQPFYERNTGRLSIESTPSAELVNPVGKMPLKDKRAFHLKQERELTSPGGGDVIAEQIGALGNPEGKFVGTGVWTDANGVTHYNPVTRTPIMAAVGQGTAALEAASKEVLRQVGAYHGLLRGQADVGFDFYAQAGKAADGNAIRVELGTQVTPKFIEDMNAALKQEFGDFAYVGPSKDNTGVNINFYSDQQGPWQRGKTPNEVFQRRSAVVAEGLTGPKAKIQKGLQNSGDLITYAKKYTPSKWMEVINSNPEIRARVNQIIPQIAARLEKLNASTGGKWDPIYTRVLEALRTRGLDGVDELVKKGIVPATVLAVIYQEATDPGASPEA